MIVFIQPMYSKRELNADSNYVVYTSWVRGLRRRRPDWRFLVLFPDAASGFRYEDDGFFRDPAIMRIAQRISPRKRANAVTYDGTFYDELYRRFGIDVVWCNLVEIAAHLAMAGDSNYDPVCRPLCVAAHNYVIHRSLPYPEESQENLILAQLSGAVVADHNVFNSAHCRWMLAENAGRWLAPDQVARIEAKSSMIPYGTLEPDLPSSLARPPNEIPVIAYNHRLQSYKNWRTTFEVLARLWGEGLRFRVRYLNNTADNLAGIQGYPFVEVRLCATRREYLDALVGCDLNVTNSQHETFCISAVESMAMGQPLVAPAAITFPEITGREELDYPFLFESEAEEARHVAHLLRDAGARREWGARLAARVRRQYGQDAWADAYAGLFERLSAELRPNPSEDALELARREMRAHEGKTLAELHRALKGQELNGRVPFSNQSLTPHKLMRLVRLLGGRISLEGGSQKVHAR